MNNLCRKLKPQNQSQKLKLLQKKLEVEQPEPQPEPTPTEPVEEVKVETAPEDAVDVGKLFLTVDELYESLPKTTKDKLASSSEIDVIYFQLSDNTFGAQFNWSESDLNILIQVFEYVSDAQANVGQRYSKCIKNFMGKLERSTILDPNNKKCTEQERDIFGDRANAGFFQETEQARYLKGIGFSGKNIFAEVIEYGSEHYNELALLKLVASRLDSKIKDSGFAGKKKVYISPAFKELLGDRAPVKIVFTDEQIEGYEKDFNALYPTLQELDARPNNFSCEQRAEILDEAYALLGNLTFLESKIKNKQIK